MMKKWICLVALVALAPAGHLAAQEEEPSFRVIVNAANAIAAVERTRVSKMFLRKIKTWPDAELWVRPIDQGQQSAIREAFTLDIHRKKVSAIRSYWDRMIFSGRDVPPPEASSDQAVLDLVRGEPGAIGYVAAGTDLGEGVKELTVTE